MLLLAEVPAVVAPEADDGVVAMGGLLQPVEQAAELRVHERDAGEVGLHGLLPPTGGEDFRVVAVGLGHLHAGGRHVVQVVHAMRRELDGLEWEQVEVFLGHAEGQVRLHETDGEEERFPVRFSELLDAVAGDFEVRHVLVRVRERAELDAADAVVLRAGVKFKTSATAAVAGEVFRPLAIAVVAGVINLPCAEDLVAGLEELRRERLLLRDGGLPILAVVVNARLAGAPTGHECGARGVAHGRGAIGAGEGDAQLREPVNVRRLGLRVAPEVADPVVEVVHGDEEDVGFLGIGGTEAGREGEQAGEQQEETFRGHKCAQVVAGRTRGTEVWLAASWHGYAVADFTVRWTFLTLASHDGTAVPNPAGDAG